MSILIILTKYWVVGMNKIFEVMIEKYILLQICKFFNDISFSIIRLLGDNTLLALKITKILYFT